METCANYTTKDCMFFSSDERRWIHKVQVLAEKYPDEVTIIRQPETTMAASTQRCRFDT